MMMCHPVMLLCSFVKFVPAVARLFCLTLLESCLTMLGASICYVRKIFGILDPLSPLVRFLG